MNKEEIIEDIKELISTSKDDRIEINPKFLKYFEMEELLAIKEQLTIKKSKIRESTFDYLDEIYEKIKEDSI